MSVTYKNGTNRSSYQTSIDQGLDLNRESVTMKFFKTQQPPSPVRFENNEQLPDDITWLITGEEVKKYIPKISVQTARGRCEGKLILTNYRFRFEPNDDVPEHLKTLINFPLGLINKVAKFGHKRYTFNEDYYGVQIVCKNFNKIKLYHVSPSESRLSLCKAISEVAFPLSYGNTLFSAVYKDQYRNNGWLLYNVDKEFERMSLPNSSWMISDMNKDFEKISTYPRKLVLPAELETKSEEFLNRVISYRSSGRIPTLVWYDPITTASICRAAQPMKGLQMKSCDEDLEYFQMIRRTNKNQNDRNMRIFDARPPSNANANIGRGGGYEMFYTNCKLIFLNIHSIHAVRKSESTWRSKMYPTGKVKDANNCKWLIHLQSIINAVYKIVKEVRYYHCNAVIHCSDGWDRTSQLTSLSMLLLDSYYRTIEGFGLLIEKEWLSYGHKFSIRYGHGIDDPTSNERAPIFLQFVDCVWQYLCCYPNYFEFTTLLLKEMADELFSCRFGTFMCNNEKQRYDEKIKENTISFWSYVLDNKEKFINKNYEKYDKTILTEEPLKCRVWYEYYCQYNIDKATEAIQNQNKKCNESPKLLEPPTISDKDVFEVISAESRV